MTKRQFEEEGLREHARWTEGTIFFFVVCTFSNVIELHCTKD